MNEIDAALMQFESAWRNGESPQIAEFLPDGKNQRDVLLELVAVDLEFRWRRAAGQTSDLRYAETIGPAAPGHGDITGQLPNMPTLEDYIDRFTQLGPPARLPTDVVAHEYYVRSKWGDRPSSESYQTRFPVQYAAFCDAIGEFADELSAILQRHADDTAAVAAGGADTLPPGETSAKSKPYRGWITPMS